MENVNGVGVMPPKLQRNAKGNCMTIENPGIGHNNPPSDVSVDDAPDRTPPVAAQGYAAAIEQVVVKVLPDGRVSRRDAAAYLGLAAKTLSMWSLEGRGPPVIRVGGRCFYYLKHLEAEVHGGVGQ